MDHSSGRGVDDEDAPGSGFGPDDEDEEDEDEDAGSGGCKIIYLDVVFFSLLFSFCVIACLFNLLENGLLCFVFVNDIFLKHVLRISIACRYQQHT